MPILSRDEFVASLRKSGVVENKLLDEWLARVSDRDSRTLAAKLVRDQMVTSWQAKYLMTGRTRLTIANYRLLTRISRDRLGDRFEAVHQQLGREVIMQVLPAEIAKNPQTLEPLMDRLRKAAELDHPNLVHVFDIDHEGDRYFVVTERLQGTPLSEIASQELTDVLVARTIRDITSGLCGAHQMGLSCGNLEASNIVVQDDGQAKLNGLIMSVMRRQVEGDDNDSQEATSDFAAISEIGQQLLKELPVSQSGPGANALHDIIKQISAGKSPGVETAGAAVEQLDEWLAEFGSVEEPDTNERPGVSGVAAAAGTVSTDSDPNESGINRETAGRTPFKGAPESSAKDQARPISPQQHYPPHEQTGVALANNQWLIGAVLAAVVLLAAWGVQRFVLSGDDKTALNVPEQPTTDSVASQRPSPTENPARQKEKKQDTSLQNISSLKIGPPPSDGEVTNAEPTNVKPPDVKPTDVKPIGADTPPPKTSPLKEEQSLKNEDKRPVESSAVDSPPTEQKPTPKKTATSNTVAKKASGKKTDRPFSDLPKAIDLPPRQQTDDFLVSDLVIDDRFLLGLELVSEETISRGKRNFSLKQSETDKQLWQIRVQSRRRGEPVAVAQFQKTDSQFVFRWLAKASELEGADYLRNCKLKLLAGDTVGWLGLRRPIEIVDFQFDGESTSLKTELELPWLPDAGALKIELKKIEIDADVDVDGPVFNNSIVTKKQPGRILFSEKPELQFVFIEVTADTRKKTKLRAEIQVLAQSGRFTPIKNVNNFKEYVEWLVQQKQQANFNQQQISSTDRPEEISYKDFLQMKRDIKAAAKLADERAEAGTKYLSMVNQLAGKTLPVRVYFNLGDHEVVLARTPQAPDNK